MFKQQSIAYKTIVLIELKRIIRIWSQTLLPPAITSVLYFIIFGQIIGHRVGKMGGYDYIQYIAPGLIMMNIITSSYASTVSAFFSAKFNRSIEEILVAPTSPAVIVLGYMSTGVARGLIVGLIVSLIALFFTHLHVYFFTAIIVAAIFSACIFSLVGVINAVFAKNFDDISIVPTFVLTPLTYLGGVFYPISLLPPVWQYISKINPIVYIIDNFRYGFLGIVGAHVLMSYFIMLGMIIALFATTYYLVNKGIGLKN